MFNQDFIGKIKTLNNINFGNTNSYQNYNFMHAQLNLEFIIEFDLSIKIILFYSRKVVKCRVKRVERCESVYCIYAH